jgi:hypothetical protein
MSNIEGTAWQGPFESREAFEVFQDESIGRLIDYALQPPQLTSEPEQLQAELWMMGKYLPAAILGLGRHNPQGTCLRVYGEKAEEESRKDPDYYRKGSRINPGATILNGEDAYERMVNSWHEVDDLRHQHRFSVQSETPHELEIVHSGKHCLLIGHWMMLGERVLYCMEDVHLPDTSRDSNIQDVDWNYAGAGATDGWGSKSIRYTTCPIPTGEKDHSELLNEGVELLAGDAALRALRDYGGVGLYQHLLRNSTSQVLSGLSLGPSMKLG